jgi:hypothetical protein
MSLVSLFAVVFSKDELLAPLREKDLKEEKRREDTTALKETKKF